jgi:hypothetical protein
MHFNAFTFSMVATTAFGAIILWCKLGNEQLSVWGLGKLWDMFGLKTKWFQITEFVSFVVIGVVVGMALAHPTTIAQAFTTGLGWTGLLASEKPRAARSKG